MEAEHLLTVPSPGDVAACTAAALGQHGPELVVATADSDKKLNFHRPFRTASDETFWSLSAHSRSVELLVFSSSPPLQLVSISSDVISIWQLENSLPLSPGGAPPCEMIALPSLHGDLVCACLNTSSQYLAISVGAVTLIVDIQIREQVAVLEGHMSSITSSIFHPHHSHTLITTALDRTFKVWDVKRANVIYNSPVMSSHPLMSAAVDPLNEVLSVTAANGMVWQLDMSPGGGYKPLLKCNVWREREKFIRREDVEDEEEEEDGEAGTAIINLHYCSLSLEQRSKDTLQSEGVLGERRRLLLIGHTSIICLDPNTFTAINFLEFRDPIPSKMTPPSSILPVASSCHVITCLLDNQVYMILEGMFERNISLLSLTINHRPDNGSTKYCSNSKILSFLSSKPPASNSPLRSEFIPKPHPLATKATVGRERKMNRARENSSVGQVLDKPLTFKTKIKSSGYATSPRMKMFTPNSAASTTSSKTKFSLSKPTTAVRERRLYPTGGRAPTDLLSRINPSSNPATITSLSFSGDGRYVGCGSSDRALYLMKLPPSEQRIQALAGHNGAVLSVDWTHSTDQLILTGSADGTAKLWMPTNRDSLLTISNKQSASHGLKTNAVPSAVSDVVFYYLDKFILLSSSNTLSLYKYHIDHQPVHDIKRYQRSTGFKLVQSLPMKDMQNITCMASINDFLSHLVIVGGSNKNIEVLDMNVGRSVRTVTECHTRQPHYISLNKGSRGVSHPEWVYDLFLTAAISDGIKLWDLRTNRCIRCLSSHVNRCHSLTAEFSPCSRFIATGSEDRSAYIYDLRTLSPLHKLSGHSETVSSVSFHPLTPMLTTGTLSGQISFYNHQVHSQ